MKRFWPKTLSGRLVLTLLLAVAVSQIVTLVIYRFERAHALRGVIGEECLGRVASAFRLTQGTPPAQRAETLRAIETPLTRYWITTDRIASPESWQQSARDRLLQPVSASGSSSSQHSLFQNETMLDSISGASWKDLSGNNILLEKHAYILDLSHWNGFGFCLPLGDGNWLNMVYAKPEFLMHNKLTPGYYTALGFTVLIFAGLAIFVARRISLPLRRLTKSVESLGRGEQLEMLPEEGPDDIRSTVAAFNRMQVRLRRFVEDRTRMLAAIGHDLRTPITSLRLRTEFINDPEMREKFTATLDEMQGMAEAALSFAKSESLAEPTRVVDLHALLESTCDDLIDLDWKVSFSGSGRLPYPCRPIAFRRAFRNIVENAVRYGDEARVSIESSSSGHEIIVEDNGPGIGEKDRERVFDPFVRLETSRSRDTGGVGLGLSIARSIIRNHGGEITLSQGKAGLKVHIHLPEASVQTSSPESFPPDKEH